MSDKVKKSATANKDAAEKRIANLKPFKPGQSGNPLGRPKNEVSITHWLKEFGAMSGPEAAKLCTVWGKELNKLDAGLPLAAMVALRAWMSQINEPQPGMFGHVLERVDGPVEKGDMNLALIRIEYVNDWRNTPADDAPRPASRDAEPAALQPPTGGQALAENIGSDESVS